MGKSRANTGSNRPSAAQHAALPARKAEAKIQPGTRIAKAKYRQLKLCRRAAQRNGADARQACDSAVSEEPSGIGAQQPGRPKSPGSHRRSGRVSWAGIGHLTNRKYEAH
jgi:hypothetical protein